MFKKRIATFFVAFAVMFGGATAIAAPAQAAWYCPPELICFYYGTNGTGQQYNFNVQLGSSPWKRTTIGEPLRSNVHSVKNNKANTYISRLYWEGCDVVAYWQTVISPPGGGNYGPPLTCFQVNWN